MQNLNNLRFNKTWTRTGVTPNTASIQNGFCLLGPLGIQSYRLIVWGEGLDGRVSEQLGLTGWNSVRQADRYLRKEAL